MKDSAVCSVVLLKVGDIDSYHGQSIGMRPLRQSLNRFCFFIMIMETGVDSRFRIHLDFCRVSCDYLTDFKVKAMQVLSLLLIIIIIAPPTPRHFVCRYLSAATYHCNGTQQLFFMHAPQRPVMNSGNHVRVQIAHGSNGNPRNGLII